jgi:hypothetical protein
MKRLMLVALSVLGLSVAAQPIAVHAQKAKAMTVSGVVKAVAGDSLTITSGGKDMTFKVDGTTKFVGKGLGTKASAGKITATDAVAANDRVSVTYHDMAGTLHAASVRVSAKGSVPKK